MPLTKSHRTVSLEAREVRYNHLDALGGIELKPYVPSKHAIGAVLAKRSRAELCSAIVPLRGGEPRY